MKTLEAASSSGHENLMLYLLDQLISKTETPGNVEWPPLLIYWAAWLGLVGFADKILGLGCPPDPEVEWTETLKASPLFEASRAGHLKTVRALVKHSANHKFAGGSYDRTPLHLAAVEGHTEVARVLLEEGKAEIDASSDDNFIPLPEEDFQWVPLVVASDDGLEKCVRPLLDNGANVDICGPDGTPLRYSACSGYLEVCNMLLAAGANPKSELLDMPILHQIFNMTSREKMLGILDQFLETDLDVNAKNKKGVTALLFAMFAWPARVEDFKITCLEDNVRVDAIRKFLDHGADTNVPTGAGSYPLPFAVSRDRYKLVELLVQRGANLDQSDQFNETAVTRALKQPDILRLLLKKGANPDLSKRASQTPLIASVEGGLTEVVELLLEHNASIDMNYDRIWKKWNVIRSAAIGEYLQEFLEFSSRIDIDEGDDKKGIAAIRHPDTPRDNPRRLLNAGATIEAVTTRSRNTPLSAAVTTTDGLARAKLLLERGVSINRGSPWNGSPLCQACWRGEWETAKFLVEQCANVNQTCDGLNVDVRDNMDCMPIHLAALNGIRNFEVILENGGDINARDKMGRTALHWAAQSGHRQVVEKIISLLSDKTAIDAPDIDGWTPLCWAARRPSWLDEEFASESPEQKEVITLLLENGADTAVLASVGDEKWTPLDIGRFSACARESMALLARGVVSNDASDGPEKHGEIGEPHKVKLRRGYYQNYYCDACHWASSSPSRIANFNIC
ncbi:hypothetical protein CEP54_011827 [Fusarium duplospermum]|uniref:Uncharacterized protein n=1 Tax=Fusarium duplospermum TaxID=1325734 RepID=A0A428PCD6_9HYPO|nr:hypothetical protein CEP54_011827 [Fusarium duplospermum]